MGQRKEPQFKDSLCLRNVLLSSAKNNAQNGASLSNIIEIANYSNLGHLLRVTAYVPQFVQLLRRWDVETVTQEMGKAEIEWVKVAQRELVKERNFPMWKQQFQLFVDGDGVWRCGGRLANTSAPYSTRFPARTHYFTNLIVRQAHESILHNGVKETLTEIRSKYWVIRRSLIKRLLFECTLCGRFEGVAYRGPPPPPLPVYRVNEAPPFTNSGVDFAGPLHVRMTTSDKCTSKVWICLFTCCTTRAVHLDIVPNLSTLTFFRCFKRFTARRGIHSKKRDSQNNDLRQWKDF